MCLQTRMSGSRDTPYSQLSICHTFNMSCTRATIWDMLISPASAILLKLMPCWSTVVLKSSFSHSKESAGPRDRPLDKCTLLSHSRSTSMQNSVFFTMPMSLNVKGTLAYTSLYIAVSKDQSRHTELWWPFRANSGAGSKFGNKMPTTGLSLFFQHYQDMLI